MPPSSSRPRHSAGLSVRRARPAAAGSGACGSLLGMQLARPGCSPALSGDHSFSPPPFEGCLACSALSCGVGGRCGPKSRPARPFGSRRYPQGRAGRATADAAAVSKEPGRASSPALAEPGRRRDRVDGPLPAARWTKQPGKGHRRGGAPLSRTRPAAPVHGCGPESPPGGSAPSTTSGAPPRRAFRFPVCPPGLFPFVRLVPVSRRPAFLQAPSLRPSLSGSVPVGFPQVSLPLSNLHVSAAARRICGCWSRAGATKVTSPGAIPGSDPPGPPAPQMFPGERIGCAARRAGLITACIL